MSSFSKYVGNGAQTVFTVNQPMPSYSALEVSLDGVPHTSGFTYNRVNATVTFAVAPDDGVVVKLARVTQVEPIHKFATGAAFTARNVDTNFTQESYRVEELQDNVVGVKELEESVLQAAEDAQLVLDTLTTDYVQVGTFAAGYDSLQHVKQTLRYSDGHDYGWTGDFPKIVIPGDSPTPLGVGGWVDRSDVTLRGDVYESLRNWSYNAAAKLGYSLVLGSFEKGAILTSDTQAILEERTQALYHWLGVFPSGGIVVTPGDSPNNSPHWAPIEQYQDELYATNFLPVGYVTDGSVEYLDYLQRAINMGASSNVPVVMPNFPVMIRADDPNEISGLNIPSGSVIKFQVDSKLLMQPNALPQYEMLRIRNARDIKIYGATLIGDKYTHLGTSGEWGMGISIRGSCENILIVDPVCDSMWGDGIYIGQVSNGDNTAPKDIKIIRPTTERCRRQGMSVTSVSGLYIQRPTFNNTKSSDCLTPLPAGPHAGIDFEPDSFKSALDNIVIEGLNGYGNDAELFYVALPLTAVGWDAPARYNVDITVNGISDDSSRGAIGLHGLAKNAGGYTGSIRLNDVKSIRAKRNPFFCVDWFASEHLECTINGLSIADWQMLGGSWAENCPIVFRVSESATYPSAIFPRVGNIHIKGVTVRHFIITPPSGGEWLTYSDNNNGFKNLSIEFIDIGTATKPSVYALGVIKYKFPLEWSQVGTDINTNLTFNPANAGEYSIYATAAVTLPSITPRFVGQSYKFKVDSATPGDFVRFVAGSTPLYANGVLANPSGVNFTAMSGRVKLHIGESAYYINTEGLAGQ